MSSRQRGETGAATAAVIEFEGKGGAAMWEVEATRQPRTRLTTEASRSIPHFPVLHDVHINRIPYPGQLSYRELDSIVKADIESSR